MGQLLSILNLRGNDAPVPDLGFDIENAKPSAEELQLHNQLSSVLVQPTAGLLRALENYQPASKLIHDAIATPSEENENKAWEGVLPMVDMLRDFYDYSLEMQRTLPQLLNVLCQGNGHTSLKQHQGLTRLFADMLNFVFEFDHLKMRSPALQNDFSYYRRMLQRGRSSATRQSTTTDENSVSDLRRAMLEDDQANRMSLFIAYPAPMLKCTLETATDYVTQNRQQKSVCEYLSALWATCFHTASKSQQPETRTFCLKVMVVAIILFDHIDPQGSFHKSSPINIKHSVKLIQSVPKVSESASASNLIHTLRYNSKHLNDSSTPRWIKNTVMAG